MRLLLVEDSRRLRDSLCAGLTRMGYAIDCAPDGETGLSHTRRHSYDVIILDLMLPKMDGMTVLQNLRRERNPARVIILTAKDAVPDRVAGLQTGADDYMTKPFSLDELVARIQALARRGYGENTPNIQLRSLVLDIAGRRALRGANELELTAREYAILELLALRRGRVVSRQQIEESVYDGRRDSLASNAVDSAICVLRKKIDEPGQTSLIKTRRGLGYMLDAENSELR